MDVFSDCPVESGNVWPRVLLDGTFVQHADGTYTCTNCRGGPYVYLWACLHRDEPCECTEGAEIRKGRDTLSTLADEQANQAIQSEPSMAVKCTIFSTQVEKAGLLSGRSRTKCGRIPAKRSNALLLSMFVEDVASAASVLNLVIGERDNTSWWSML